MQSGMTALMLASVENSVDVASLLLRHGASVQTTDEVCTCVCTCTHMKSVLDVDQNNVTSYLQLHVSYCYIMSYSNHGNQVGTCIYE